MLALEKDTYELISQNLPVIKELQKVVASFDPDFISMAFDPDSSIPEAAVCLKDAFETLREARYALREAYANKIWHLEKITPPDEIGAIIYSRFYLDDVALRLYPAGEHLAYAIIKMLEIKDSTLVPFKENRISLQSIVGRFLEETKTDHPITRAVIKLAKSEEWIKTHNYRNSWVHEQPPTLKGLGMVFKRRKRWVAHRNSLVIPIGEGDDPDYSIEDLFMFIKPALFIFTETFEKVLNIFIELLKKKGIVYSYQPLNGEVKG
jgi:hypothetical protein